MFLYPANDFRISFQRIYIIPRAQKRADATIENHHAERILIIYIIASLYMSHSEAMQQLLVPSNKSEVQCSRVSVPQLSFSSATVPIISIQLDISSLRSHHKRQRARTQNVLHKWKQDLQ